MGIHGLMNFFKNCIKEREANNYNDTQIVVDASLLIYRYAVAIRKNGTDMCNSNGKSINHLHAIMTFTLFLLRIGISPTYVFDGKAPDLKKITLDKRSKNIRRALDNIDPNDTKSNEYIQNFKKSYSLTGIEVKECMELLDHMGISYVRAKGEADSYCAALSNTENIYGVISNDSDLLVFGAKILLKNFSGNKIIEEICLNDIYDYMRFKANEIRINNKMILIKNVIHENFIDFSILLGSDYAPHIKGFTPEELYEYFVISEFDIERTVDNLHNHINNVNNKNDYEIPNDFLKKAQEVKEYYLHAQYIRPIIINKSFSKPNKEKLIEFLCNKNYIDQIYVSEYVTELESLYHSIIAFGNRKNDNNFQSFRGYQWKYYKSMYNSNNNINKNINNNDPKFMTPQFKLSLSPKGIPIKSPNNNYRQRCSKRNLCNDNKQSRYVLDLNNNRFASLAHCDT